MSQPCATQKCERISRGLCDCCKQNLCLQHLSEHNERLVLQLNPLTDEINVLGDRLKSFDTHGTVGDGRQKLEKWRKDCYKKIDRVFEEKCQELDRLVAEKLTQQQKKLLQIQTKVTKLVREQEVTRQEIDFLTFTVGQLRQELDIIERNNIQVHAYSVMIDNTLVQISQTNERELDLSKLFPVYRTLNSPVGSGVALAKNEQFLLVHQKPNLYLIDKEVNVTKQVLWESDGIQDMCWSATLDRFIVIDNNNIFLIDEKTMSIQIIETIKKEPWSSCTCSDRSFFLATNVWGSSVVEMRLLPSISIIKEWKPPTVCGKAENISGMSYHSNMCAMVIMNNAEKAVRIELRCCKTMESVWSFPLSTRVNKITQFTCCSLTCNEWLMIDYETKHLIHITQDGKLKQAIPYNKIPYCASLFGSNMLVVATDSGINFHKI